MFEAPSILFAAAGAAVFVAAVLPKLLRNAPFSMPMVFLGAGLAAFSVIPGLPDPDPIVHSGFALHLAEVCVIISLMGAGLALDRPVGRRSWSTTWRLLGIAMPLCIVALTLMGLWFLGLGLGAALLVASSLAPTDPVLASEVQVGEPADEENEDNQEDEVRFGLTSEAGLNDGLAFPFVYLAIAISVVGAAPSAWFPQWFGVDVVWRLGLGVLLGFGIGKLLALLFFSAKKQSLRLANHSEGFVALAATFLAYGLTEMVEGYGFIAVFVCAVTIRSAEHTTATTACSTPTWSSSKRLMTVVILVLLGGAIARGLLSEIGWAELLVALAFLLVVRPAAAGSGCWAENGPARTHCPVLFRHPRHRLAVLPRVRARQRAIHGAGRVAVVLCGAGGGAVHCYPRGQHLAADEPPGPPAGAEGPGGHRATRARPPPRPFRRTR